MIRSSLYHQVFQISRFLYALFFLFIVRPRSMFHTKSKVFLCPRHKMAWGMDPPFSHSVIIQFPFIISAMDAQMNASYDYAGKARIWSWSEVFDRVIPLELSKNMKIFSFHSLSLQRLHTFNSNLIYGYIIRLCRTNSNFVMVQWFLSELFFLRKFSVSALYHKFM
jgi:hypothetical protein